MPQDLNEDLTISDEVRSKINAAGLINLTTNNLWNEFFNDFRKGKYLSANNTLDCLWVIFGAEKTIPGTDDEQIQKDIEMELSNSGSLTDGVSTKGFSGVPPKDLKKQAVQKNILLKKALFLGRLQNKQGKGTAYETGEADYMDG